MKNKNIKALISQIALLIVFTFLGGFFVPQKFLEEKLSILGLLIAIWGVTITLFVFVQGVVQSCKSNLLNSNSSKDYVVEKYGKIDRIIRELMQDIKCISIMLAVYFVFIIFFTQIDNAVWQKITIYIQFFIFGVIILAVVDLIGTMIKLVRINELLNMSAAKNKGENNDGK